MLLLFQISAVPEVLIISRRALAREGDYEMMPVSAGIVGDFCRSRIIC